MKPMVVNVYYGQENLNWTIDQWKYVLWSDESPYVMRYSGRTRVWRLLNEQYNVQLLKETVKHDKKIMVWDVLVGMEQVICTVLMGLCVLQTIVRY